MEVFFIDNLILTNESEYKGFKIRTYIENLPQEERKKRDAQLAQDLYKILFDINKKETKK